MEKWIEHISVEFVESIKSKYPKGTRIECIKMYDLYHPIPSGTHGTVEHVDDCGTIHMTWDNGSGLGLLPYEDEFKIIEERESK